MLYMLQIDVLVAIVILFVFFALYLVLMALRLGYFAAVWLVQIAKPNTGHSTKERLATDFTDSTDGRIQNQFLAPIR
jgi:hypothetical protein